MPRMRKKILTVSLAITAMCSIGISSLAVATPSTSRHTWHFSDFFSSHRNFWTVISHQFELDRQYSNNYYVRKQIRWFRKQQYYIFELTRNAQPYIYYILEQTRKRGMPAEIALLPMIESNYNPFVYSRVGAVGLWQLMPGTASGLGIRINWWYDGRRDLVASTNAALNYLQYLHDYFHSWLLAIAAYNSGEGTVVNAIRYNRRHHRPTDFWSLPLPQETRNYVPKLLALAHVLKYHNSYGIRLIPVENEPYLTSVKVKKQMNVRSLAKLAKTSPKTIRKLNAGFRRWTTAPDHSYNILVPLDKATTFKTNLALVESQSKNSKWIHHRVQSGETLSALADRYNTTINALRHINKLSTNVLQIGENLLIPAAVAEPLPPHHVHSRKISEDSIPGPKRCVHIVKRGDTISEIADRYHVTAKQIYYWNNFNTHTNLQVGQKLIIWSKHKTSSKYHNHSGFYHRVKRGESLSLLAHRYHTTTTRIREANHMHNSVLQIGQRLYIR